jgi:hypothetical protein
MEKTYSRRKFLGNSLKGLAGICLLGLVGCSKKEKLEENFWETKEYSKTLKKIYRLANEVRPENSSTGNQVGAVMRMRHYDSNEHNPGMINENEDVINTQNYHPSLHSLKRTLRDYETEIAAIKRGDDPNYVGDYFGKH